MLLATAAFLTAAGFVAWGGGVLLDYPAIAVIGATLVVGVGASIATDGLTRQTGVVETTNDSTNTTVKDFQYTQVEVASSFPLGFLLTLLGGIGVLHPLNGVGGGL